MLTDKPNTLTKADKIDPRHSKLSGALRCTNKFEPSCGCTVVTKEVMHEGVIAIRSFQVTNGQKPVLVMCGDKESYRYMTGCNLPSVEVAYREAVKPSAIKEHNTYHRTDAILLKMEVFSMAVSKYGDSVFFDCDIIFLEKLSGPEDCEVALSFNCPAFVAQHQHGVNYGIFNAGLVWTCNTAFPAWWKHQYCHPEAKFYEQSGMNHAPAAFRCGYFDLAHNYGFWRGAIDNRKVKSLHVHLSTGVDHKMIVADKWSMLAEVRTARREVWKLLNSVRYKHIGQLCRVSLKHPRKVFFCHYGKVAGIYTDKVMVHQIIPDYERQNSWVDKLERDWTQEELQTRIKGATHDSWVYLHQHHTGIKEEDIDLAREHKWLTFMFVQNPVKTICSLYHWDKRRFAETGKGTVLPELNPLSRMSFREFWFCMLEEEQHSLWAMPGWIRKVDDVAIFSDTNFDAFLTKRFGMTHSPVGKENVSGNPGYTVLRENGAITDDMMEALQRLPDYREFVSLFGESL